jgi:hypothetical protein
MRGGKQQNGNGYSLISTGEKTIKVSKKRRENGLEAYS